MLQITRTLALAICLLAGGMGPLLAQDLEDVRCEFGPLVTGWQGQVTCSRMRVPEYRADESSPEIGIAVYTINPLEETDAAPVFYLTGGPGVAADFYVATLLLHPLHEVRPIVIMEHRGVGRSTELCPEARREYYRRVMSRRSDEMRQRQMIGIMQRCFARAREDGRVLEGYTSEEIARDLDDLRRAMGLERIDIWAASYGTVVAQAFMGLEPEAVGAVMFDASVPIDYPLERGLIANFRALLDVHWRACIARGECDANEPDFATRMITLINEYNARPLRLLGFVPEPGVAVSTVYVTGSDVAGMIFSLLYESDGGESVNRVLSILERRSHSFLRAYHQRLVIPGFSYGMHYAVNCQGARPDPSHLAELRVAEPVLFDAMQVGLQEELCVAEGLGEVGYRPEPVSFDRRIFVVSGSVDPITPLSVAEPLRERFPRGGFLEVAGGGHGPSRSLVCAAEMTRQYFAAPNGPVYDYCGYIAAPPGTESVQ